MTPAEVNGKTYMGVRVNDCIGKRMVENKRICNGEQENLQWNYMGIYTYNIYKYIRAFSVSVCRDSHTKMPWSYAGVLLSYIIIHFCIAMLLLSVTYLLYLRERYR